MDTFEIHDPADEPQISLTEPVTDDLPEELLSQEEKDERAAAAEAEAKAEADRKAAETNAVIEKFSGILKVLEDAPAPRSAAPPPEQPQQPQPPTQAQIDEWNDKLRELSVTHPLEYQRLTQQMAEQRILSQAGPILESAGEGFIERFKSEKKGESRFFAQIEKLFEQEMSDLPPQALLQMNSQQRKAELTRRWKAAAGEFFENNAKPTQQLATTASRGTSVAPSAGSRNGRQKVLELTDGEKVALLRALGKEKAKAEIARIEYGL